MLARITTFLVGCNVAFWDHDITTGVAVCAENQLARTMRPTEVESLYPERSLKSVKRAGFDRALIPENPTFIKEIWVDYSDGREIATDAF